MGFCRHCGDLVRFGDPRCKKCGGMAVDPVVQFALASAKHQSPDKWSRTYTNNETSPEKPTLPPNEPERSRSPTKRFPRPMSSSEVPRSSTSIHPQTNQHIASIRPLSPFKSQLRPNPPSPTTQAKSGILPSPDKSASTLSKVYGSVLQSKESLAKMACANCSITFPPDGTIYPDLQGEGQFLCLPCFTERGGSKGACESCSRPVLALKSEGNFVENAGRVWHSACFCCQQCHKNIGDMPLVDVRGRPACMDCFCQQTTPSPKRRVNDSPKLPVARDEETPSNLGGLKGTRKSRESSPAIEELEQRLGIVKSRDNSPASNKIQDKFNHGSPSPGPRGSKYETKDGSPLVSRRFSSGNQSPSPTKLSHSLAQSPIRTVNTQPITPKGRYLPPSASARSSPLASRTVSGQNENVPAQLQHQQESPFQKQSPRSPAKQSRYLPPSSPSPVRVATAASRTATIPYVQKSISSSNISSDTDSTLDSDSDSAVTSSSSATSSPPSTSSPTFKDDIFTESDAIHTTPTPKHKHQSHSISPNKTCANCKGALNGDFISAPSDEHARPSQLYHSRCFKCSVCRSGFEVTAQGQAIFASADNGPCHPKCASSQKIVFPTTTPSTNRFSSYTPLTSSRMDGNANPVQQINGPRFGSAASCPGCSVRVAAMEPNVVAGPNGTRWHKRCLICGGAALRREKAAKSLYHLDKDKSQPGCGKSLDSTARCDGNGGVWCRECSMLLPREVRAPPVLSPITTTTIARQFTGMGAGGLVGTPVTRQLTGGGLSPTKQLFARQRPKSMVEGRGMYLVRQLTGVSE